jgi:phosphoglycolate phosphatase-like HAD superfamily hydrolase
MVDFYMSEQDLKPLPAAEKLFAQLREKGIKTGLNTGFTRHITNTILHRLDWKNPSPADAMICSDEVPEERPAPFMIRERMRVFGISDPARVVKVGDTEVDIPDRRNAECGLVVSVTTEAYSRK